MKTAISVDGDLLQAADKAARRMGLSRSKLFSMAMERYLRQQRLQEITEQLNRVYSKPDPEERLLPALMKAKRRTSTRERW
jgi:antitoxin MazE6